MTAERHGSGLGRPPSGKRAALAARALPDLTLSDGDDDASDEDGLWDEHTPITDAAGLYRKIGQTASMVKSLITTKMPQLEKKVDLSVEASRDAQREAFDAKNAVTLVQQRVEDVCKRVESLEPLKVNGATREVRLKAVEDNLEKSSDRRWGLWLTVIGIILAGLSSIGAAIWWARGVEAATAVESRDREAADKVLTGHIERRPTRDEMLTEKALRDTLREELNKQRQSEVESWINSLPPAKRTAIRRLVGDSPTSSQQPTL